MHDSSWLTWGMMACATYIKHTVYTREKYNEIYPQILKRFKGKAEVATYNARNIIILFVLYRNDMQYIGEQEIG